MADIFISYKREEQPIARKLADVLQMKGFSVWWDLEVRAGERFDDVIDKALQESKCVVALWSKLSVESQNVKDEATYALNLDKLVPIMIEVVKLPYRFERIHTRQLFDWDGSDTSDEFQNLIDDLAKIIGTPPVEVDKTQRAEKEVVKGRVEIGRDETFIAYSNGVVRDTSTDLEWVVGPDRDMTWDEANSWVKGLTIDGGGWLMPTVNRLESLYKRGVGTRNMTPLLKTIGWWVWSDETADSSSMWNFNFHAGVRVSINRNTSNYSRAFAVR